MLKIYSFPDKRPDFIYWQYRTICKFVEDQFVYILIDNVEKEEDSDKIREIAGEIGAEYHKCPQQDHSHPVLACYAPIQWTLNNIISKDINKDVITLIMDSDMFFVKPVCIQDFLGSYHIAGVPQVREAYKYIWNGFFLINMISAPGIKEMNFYPGRINTVPVDVGGHLYYYLQKYTPDWLKISTTSIIDSKIGNTHLLPSHKDSYQDYFQSEMIEDFIYHYRNGSNWELRTKEKEEAKTAWLIDMLKERLAQPIQPQQPQLPSGSFVS